MDNPFAVEQRKRPELRGKPSAVVQFNPWKGGGLIAVSYEARRAGVTRFVLQVLHNLTPLVFLHNVELQRHICSKSVLCNYSCTLDA
jgi:nucleotidyltransferase/DNA polymerase involved in DNA repair